MLGQVNIPHSLYQPKVESILTVHEGQRLPAEHITEGNCIAAGNKAAGNQEDNQETSTQEPGRNCGTDCECGSCTNRRMRNDLDICVCNPITDKFTTYEIKIQTVNPAFNLKCSHTRRRYNDFCWLRKILKEHHPLCNCPELPAKKNFSERFEPQFIVERMKSLEDWIFRLLEKDLYLSDTSVHLFLQTNLTCSQMESYVNGRLSSGIVRRAYKACKLKSESSFMQGLSKEPPDQPDINGIRISASDTNGIRIAASDTNGIRIAASDTNSDNDSSYESQQSYLSSSEASLVNEGNRELTRAQCRMMYNQSINSNYSVDESSASTSLTSNHCDEGTFNEYDIIPSPVKNRSNGTMTKMASTPAKEIQRVENGVIFSI